MSWSLTRSKDQGSVSSQVPAVYAFTAHSLQSSSMGPSRRDSKQLPFRYRQLVAPVAPVF